MCVSVVSIRKSEDKLGHWPLLHGDRAFFCLFAASYTRQADLPAAADFLVFVLSSGWGILGLQMRSQLLPAFPVGLGDLNSGHQLEVCSTYMTLSLSLTLRLVFIAGNFIRL